MTFSKDVILARLLGYLYGDGWISGSTVGFSGQKLDLEQIQTDLIFLGDTKHSVSTRVCENKARGIKGVGSQFVSSYLYPLFKDQHPSGKKTFQPMRVPEWIMKGKDYIKKSFLSGLFSAEATGIRYQTNRKTLRPISLNMRSIKKEWIVNWINDIGDLLDSSGIEYSKYFKDFQDTEIADPNDSGYRHIGYIDIKNSQNNIQQYINRIGFCYSADKTVSLNRHKLFTHYKNIWKSAHWKKNRAVLSKLQKNTVRVTSQELKIPESTVKYHKNTYSDLYSKPLLLPSEYINEIKWMGNYVLLPIIKENVRLSSELVDVYNLTSGAANRFFAGGLFTHNCEEMDYIDEKSITGAIMPILQTNPDTALVGFSTPSGFRTPYYYLCEDNPYYVEFHHNYKVLPHWKNVEIERSSYTEEDWEHEFEAIWGSSEDGVYKTSYIDAALQTYTYDDCTRGPAWRYCIGTDWNEKHGTEIVVLGYNTLTGRFQVVQAELVPKSEFTQLAGIQKLLDLNKKWRPSFIYIDAGNGCLHKDSMVYCSDGIKTIEDIKITDMVLTHNGSYKKVIDHVATGTKESYLLKPAFCLPTTVSTDHTHMVFRSENKFNDFPIKDMQLTEIKTSDLNPNKDFMVIPKEDVSNPIKSCVIDLVQELHDMPNLEYDDNYVWTKHGYQISGGISNQDIIDEFDTSRSTIQRTRRKTESKERMAPVEVKLFNQLNNKYGDKWLYPHLKKTNRFIDICDPEFLYIYGWYLSEGYSGVNSIEISQMPFHYKEEFDHLVSCCVKRWDTKVITRSHGRQKGMKRLFIKNSIISSLFKKIGGSHCYNKFIDSRIMQSNPIETLVSIFYGDGCEGKHGVNLSMTSMTLVSQVRQILVNNGLLAGLHYIKPRKRKDGYKDSAPQLMLYLNARENTVDLINRLLHTHVTARKGIQRRKYIETEKYFLVPIKKLNYMGKCQDMYDITVEDDASFHVNGFITHNSTNYELLRKTAYEQRHKQGDRDTAKLLDILKKYDAGASLKIKDPITSAEIRAPAKPFMVNASVRMFEQSRIVISANDQVLEKQLRSYIVERMTPTKVPVYGLAEPKVGDHRLDALNLAIVAFQLEFNDLHNVPVLTTALAIPDPRIKKMHIRSDSAMENKEHRPEDRRMEENKKVSVYGSLPGRVDNNRSNIKTNRPGWETDDEELFAAKRLQRQRGRGNVSRGRPRRSTF